jgi:hypothetical protein
MTANEESVVVWDPLLVRAIALSGSLSRPDGLAAYVEVTDPGVEGGSKSDDPVPSPERGGV